MSITKIVLAAHAAACRKALSRGELRPEWADGSLSYADLRGADLHGICLRGACLRNSYMRDINLSGADLTGADLTDTQLPDARLTDADLRGARLMRADLRFAKLAGADLRDADLRYAYLRGADLTGAKLPDGRTLAEWQADPLAGLCDDPESVARALAAWGGETWAECPLHAALGANGFDDIAVDRRALAATFVALLDGGHLPQPTAETHT
jgi:hypothetical protein